MLALRTGAGGSAPHRVLPVPQHVVHQKGSKQEEGAKPEPLCVQRHQAPAGDRPGCRLCGSHFGGLRALPALGRHTAVQVHQPGWASRGRRRRHSTGCCHGMRGTTGSQCRAGSARKAHTRHAGPPAPTKVCTTPQCPLCTHFHVPFTTAPCTPATLHPGPAAPASPSVGAHHREAGRHAAHCATGHRTQSVTVSAPPPLQVLLHAREQAGGALPLAACTTAPQMPPHSRAPAAP